ncbi:MAG: glycosyltransferase [Lachnospiraceae bacterium]|nr:glycosyltransferase [Lachnospiraceae bacterium]
MIAINADKMKDLPYSGSDDIYSYLYKLLLLEGAFRKHDLHDGKLANESVIHVPKILYHAFSPSYDVIKDMHLSDPIREKTGYVTVSVIIPSKDHPEILFRCIDSLIEVTDTKKEFDYEIIVVDNGSSEVNKKTIGDILANYNARYIYEKRDFNFSYMCNLGARNARGDYLLFLNDDMEITEHDWMHKMLIKAALPYAGAVGAKLLYPGSDMIQHAGITNLRIGPAHKLQFLSDSEDHYFGKNRYVHDMMGVTGACLMVKKAVFDEVGGFDEELKVAFNDVDLCYKIFEKGYYNIERCDVKLFHHESLSRGNDSDSDDKMYRMNREKDLLYEKHQWLYGKDPFYNINLTTDMWEYEYAPKYHYEVHLERDWARVSEITDVIRAASEDRCVRIGMECAMDIFKWKYGVERGRIDIPDSDDDNGYYLQGYTFVTGSNNACFERTLFLENTASGRCFGVETEYEFRPDIAGNVPDQLNVDLAGYTAKIRSDALPEGHYRFGMYMKDKTSRLRLYNMSNWTLDIKHND